MERLEVRMRSLENKMWRWHSNGLDLEVYNMAMESGVLYEDKIYCDYSTVQG